MTSPAPTPPQDLPVRIREVLPEESEVNYIIKTWAREFRDYIPAHMPERLYYQHQQEVIGQLASTSTSRVAVDPENINSIFGFAVGKKLSDTTLLLHYVYVRHEWQRLGLAKALIRALGYSHGMEILCTHWSHNLTKWLEPVREPPSRTQSGNLKRWVRYPFLVYNPFLLHKQRGP